MKNSTLLWIGGGIAVWYFFIRKKDDASTGQSSGASTVNQSGGPVMQPLTAQAAAPELDEPDVVDYGPVEFWQPGWGSGFRPNWRGGGGGGRHHHGGGGHRGRR
jgi:hypothetical protein